MTPEQELVIECARAWVDSPFPSSVRAAALYEAVDALDAAERPSTLEQIVTDAITDSYGYKGGSVRWMEPTDGIVAAIATNAAKRLREAGLVKDDDA